MVSKLSKIKLKGQRSVLKLIKDREVTDLHAEGNNSDIPSEDKLNSSSASRVTNSTPGCKERKEVHKKPTTTLRKKSIWEKTL